ncbi:MAG TPA: ThiF family adenylyltransferase [Solirubrobacteraceae bacterium]
MAASDRLNIDLAQSDGRYDRQELITWWDQSLLGNARVLVLGAGALGNEIVKNLALLGVGTIVVADLDRVENSNLSRCLFFREEHEGMPKASVVAAGARELNPQIDVVGVDGDLRLTLGLSAYRDADVVVGGLDNREARLHANQACWKTSTPWIDGAIEGLLGVARTFVPPESACYECTMNEQDRRLLAARRACSLLTREQMQGGHVPTTATTSSVIAGIQAQETVKLLHRETIPYTFAGRGFVYNGLTHDSYVVTYARDELCMSHDTYDLERSRSIAHRTRFGDVLADAVDVLGEGAVLDLELELVVTMTCPACALETVVCRPLEELAAGAASCPRCSEERTLDARHQVDADTPVLSEKTLEEVGIPLGDVLTARSGERRHHYVVEEALVRA